MPRAATQGLRPTPQPPRPPLPQLPCGRGHTGRVRFQPAQPGCWFSRLITLRHPCHHEGPCRSLPRGYQEKEEGLRQSTPVRQWDPGPAGQRTTRSGGHTACTLARPHAVHPKHRACRYGSLIWGSGRPSLARTTKDAGDHNTKRPTRKEVPWDTEGCPLALGQA